MSDGLTCLVTIHGIGFQRAPSQTDPTGYADSLHQHLSSYLTPQVLGDDPNRQRPAPGQFGAIYVQSHYPTVEDGLKRLGTWNADHSSVVHDDFSRLVGDGESIGHVALVYSHAENMALQHVGSALEASINAAVTHPRYGSIFSIGGTLISDVQGQLGRGTDADCPGEEQQSLRPRNRAQQNPPPLPPPPEHRLLGVLLPWPTTVANKSNTSDASVVRALEEDVTTYVFRNDLRQGVRDFIQEALLRVCSRDDVRNVVVNAHSQGTVAAYDAVRTLPPEQASKIHSFITSGSPLRKYVDLFYWGDDVRSVFMIGSWTNFFDKYDPVADGLKPRAWQPGWGLSDAPPQSDTLFHYAAPDQADPVPYAPTDIEVHNIDHSCGAVRAHNYWDNQKEWIPQVGDMLKEAIAPATP